MDENARKRLKLSCQNANKFPIKRVATDNTTNTPYHTVAMGVNTLYKIEVKVNNTAAFDTTDKNAVTATGEPS